jgi:hypothetical protein
VRRDIVFQIIQSSSGKKGINIFTVKHAISTGGLYASNAIHTEAMQGMWQENKV